MELDSVLTVIRETHALLSPLVELDAFEVIFAEVNEAITPVSFSGRILIHTMEVLMDEVYEAQHYLQVKLASLLPTPCTSPPMRRLRCRPS